MLLDDADLLDDVHARIDAGQRPRRGPGSTRSPRSRRELAGVRRPLPAGPRRRRTRGRAAGGRASWSERPALPHRGRRRAGRRRPDPGPGRRARPDRVRGLVLASGSPTGHSAILARSRGIPAVVAAGAGGARRTRRHDRRPRRQHRRAVRRPRRRDARATSHRRRRRGPRAGRAGARRRAARRPSPSTASRSLVGANLGSVDDARAAAQNGADLAGLVRTEFLFLDRRRRARRRGAGRGLPRARRRRSAADGSRCARSTSAATSRSPYAPAAARGQPVPRRARHPAARSPAATCSTTSCRAIVRGRARDAGRA